MIKLQNTFFIGSLVKLSFFLYTYYVMVEHYVFYPTLFYFVFFCCYVEFFVSLFYLSKLLLDFKTFLAMLFHIFVMFLVPVLAMYVLATTTVFFLELPFGNLVNFYFFGIK
jgi:hypothetical protein